mmetsp:Transcript_22195/g.54964  ORF Transcript_22195/g.54964 Transcript_22195/m.54964 type:complete len:223 (-) Transcript_22195:25-693(-)
MKCTPFYLVFCFLFFYRRPLPRPMLPIPGGGGGGSIPGAPTPCIGAAPNPMGAPGTVPCEGGGGIIPRPRAMPVAALPEGGGGPSTAKLTTFSPRISTNPRLRRSCRSSSRAAPLFRKIRNSSASLNTKLRCLSKARKVPTMDRPSCRVTLSRCSTYRSSLLPFPLGIMYYYRIGVFEFFYRMDCIGRMQNVRVWFGIVCVWRGRISIRFSMCSVSASTTVG